MACSVSGQDEPNPSQCLATRVGKIVLPRSLGSMRCIPREKFVLDLQIKELSQYPAISTGVKNPYFEGVDFSKAHNFRICDRHFIVCKNFFIKSQAYMYVLKGQNSNYKLRTH